MENETVVRLLIFAGVLAVLATLELLAPRRGAALLRTQRWPAAVVLLLIASIVSRLALPMGLTGVALWAEASGIGLLNFVTQRHWTLLGLAVIVMDLSMWAQHRAMHLWHPLWRLHRVHHTDPHCDVATALRFHPAEILVSLAWKVAVVIVLGIPATVVFCYEVILSVMTQFSHSNVSLPIWLDRGLRVFIVTPDMHRVHHSVRIAEHNNNFGNFLSVWDRLFSVYTAQPRGGHQGMQIGQQESQGARYQTIAATIKEPLR